MKSKKMTSQLLADVLSIKKVKKVFIPKGLVQEGSFYFKPGAHIYKCYFLTDSGCLFNEGNTLTFFNLKEFEKLSDYFDKYHTPITIHQFMRSQDNNPNHPTGVVSSLMMASRGLI